MVITIHQPVFLPWMGFFHKVWLSDALVYLDTVQLEKQSFQYRNKILSNQGSAWVTLPIDRQGHLQKQICDHQILELERFQKKFLNSLQMTYAKSPYFKDYFESFKALLLSTNQTNMAKFNAELNQWFFTQLGLNPKIYWASELKTKGQSSLLLATICENLRGTIYIAGGRGIQYLDESIFEMRNIRVFHHHYQVHEYEQFHKPFVPFLGILDALFFLGPQCLDFICANNVTKYDLV